MTLRHYVGRNTKNGKYQRLSMPVRAILKLRTRGMTVKDYFKAWGFTHVREL